MRKLKLKLCGLGWDDGREEAGEGGDIGIYINNAQFIIFQNLVQYETSQSIINYTKHTIG